MSYSMRQPNGANVSIYVIPESSSAYSSEDFKNDPALRGVMTAQIDVSWGWNSHHMPRSCRRRLYWDDKGMYLTKKSKEPFYYWKAQNIETDYEHWTKTPKGYSIPLNEPRLLKKNLF